MARRKVRIRPFRFLFSLALIGLVLWAGWQGASRASAWMGRCSPVPETVQVARTLEGLLLRDESRIYTQNSGSVGYFVQDGERVQAGQKIAEITVSATGTQGSLASQGVLEGDRQQRDQLLIDIEALTADIAAGVNAGELDGIAALKTDLSLKLAQKVQLDNEIAALESGFMPDTAAVGSASAVKGQVLEIRSPGSGVVSFYTDGQEEALKPALYRSIPLNETAPPEPSGIAVPEIQAGALLYKLVDNSLWYLMVQISPSDQQVLGQAQGLDLKIGEEAFQATVKDVIQQENGAVLLLESRGALPNFHRLRKVQVELVMDQYPGLAVPLSAVLDSAGQPVVVTVDSANKRKAVPVQIISKLPDRIIIAEEAFYRGTGAGAERVSTVKRTDFILRKPKPEDL